MTGGYLSIDKELDTGGQGRGVREVGRGGGRVASRTRS
jgi:hypothetical protein